MNQFRIYLEGEVSRNTNGLDVGSEENRKIKDGGSSQDS